ncbi:hypothetical protein DDI_3280 [Dickeya dianthicola RNS04.9]|nr:hypothetical protein DDI_3280 [Dickeya dianthicola RNS04.9]
MFNYDKIAFTSQKTSMYFQKQLTTTLLWFNVNFYYETPLHHNFIIFRMVEKL